MAKIEINLFNENLTIKSKDDLLKQILLEMFGSESDPAKCEDIIMVTVHYQFFQMAVDMRKILESEQPYKVLTLVTPFTSAGTKAIQEQKAII